MSYAIDGLMPPRDGAKGCRLPRRCARGRPGNSAGNLSRALRWPGRSRQPPPGNSDDPVGPRPACCPACARAEAAGAEGLRPRFPCVAALMEAAEADGLADLACPAEHGQQLWRTHPLERGNREITRRPDGVGTVPQTRQSSVWSGQCAARRTLNGRLPAAPSAPSRWSSTPNTRRGWYPCPWRARHRYDGDEDHRKELPDVMGLIEGRSDEWRSGPARRSSPGNNHVRIEAVASRDRRPREQERRPGFSYTVESPSSSSASPRGTSRTPSSASRRAACSERR